MVVRWVRAGELEKEGMLRNRQIMFGLCVEAGIEHTDKLVSPMRLEGIWASSVSV